MRGTQHNVAMILILVSLSITGALWTPLSVSALTPLPQGALPTTGKGITHGAHLRPVCMPGADGSDYCYGHEIEAFNNLVGKNIGVVMYFAALVAVRPVSAQCHPRTSPLFSAPGHYADMGTGLIQPWLQPGLRGWHRACALHCSRALRQLHSWLRTGS